MRENPWHLRLPTTEHYQWFKNLVSLHELTLAWLEELKLDPSLEPFTRGLNPAVSENFWMLHQLSSKKISDILDDTLPEDLLGRLEHCVWAVQASTLQILDTKFQKQQQNPSDTDTSLEQISWNLGATTAEKRWAELAHKGCPDLRDILLAINDSPFSGYPYGNSFLVRRAIPTDIQLELRSCPHQSHYYEVKHVQDHLCQLHAQWMKGFAHSLNKKVKIEHIVQSPRCLQRWSALEDSSKK
jgi:hypothetical protein